MLQLEVHVRSVKHERTRDINIGMSPKLSHIIGVNADQCLLQVSRCDDVRALHAYFCLVLLKRRSRAAQINCFYLTGVGTRFQSDFLHSGETIQ